MTFNRTMLIALATSLAITAGQSAQAASYHHIDGLAVKLQGQARELYNEFKQHYRHVSGYSHLRSDAANMYRTAAHVHKVAHQNGGVHHLKSDLAKADRLFHHLEDVVAELEHNTAHSFGGHSHGDLSHVHALMRSMKTTLHHLRNDIEEMSYSYHSHRVYRSYPSGHSSHSGHFNSGHGHGGVTVRVGNFGFRIGH